MNMFSSTSSENLNNVKLYKKCVYAPIWKLVLLFIWQALLGILTNCINFNTKWRASSTFKAHSGGSQMYVRPATGKHGHLHT